VTPSRRDLFGLVAGAGALAVGVKAPAKPILYVFGDMHARGHHLGPCSPSIEPYRHVGYIDKTPFTYARVSDWPAVSWRPLTPADLMRRNGLLDQLVFVEGNHGC
jgi:hypothetical protein